MEAVQEWIHANPLPALAGVGSVVFLLLYLFTHRFFRFLFLLISLGLAAYLGYSLLALIDFQRLEAVVGSVIAALIVLVLIDDELTPRGPWGMDPRQWRW